MSARAAPGALVNGERLMLPPPMLYSIARGESESNSRWSCAESSPSFTGRLAADTGR